MLSVALGPFRVEIAWSDEALEKVVRRAVGLGFTTQFSAGPAFRILFDSASENLVLAGATLEVGVRGAATSDPVRFYYQQVEPALIIAGASLGYTGLHAAAVVLDERPLVLIGERRAGKSTTAAAIRCMGGRLLTDDSVYLRFLGPHTVELCAYPREIHLERRICHAWGLVPDYAQLTEYHPGTDRVALPLSTPDVWPLSWTGPASSVELLLLERCAPALEPLQPTEDPNELTRRLRAHLLRPRREPPGFQAGDPEAVLRRLADHTLGWCMRRPDHEVETADYPQTLSRILETRHLGKHHAGGPAS